MRRPGLLPCSGGVSGPAAMFGGVSAPAFYFLFLLITGANFNAKLMPTELIWTCP